MDGGVRTMAIVEHNEWCGNCDYEGQTRVDTSLAQIDTATELETGKSGILVVTEYEWICPNCGYNHCVHNDEEVGIEMAEAWKDEGAF